jgi:polyhydroxybutyrate depolymerase
MSSPPSAPGEADARAGGWGASPARRALRCAALLLLALSACQGASPGPIAEPPAPATAPAAPSPDALVSARPYTLLTPPSYDPKAPAPLLLLLHPYGQPAAEFPGWIGLQDLALSRGFLLAAPEGLTDKNGRPFWNATDACCDFYGRGVDDVAYLAAVIKDARARYAVDPARIYALGYSNGGFMAQRLACELPEVAAAVSLVGADRKAATPCPRKTPAAVLAVAGDKDEIVPYGGGPLGGRFPKRGEAPSAREGAAAWAARNGCKGALTPDAPRDLASDLPGAETEIEAYAGCPRGGAVELWTVRGAGHVFAFGADLPQALLDFLETSGR